MFISVSLSVAVHGVTVQAVLQLTYLMATGSDSSLVIGSTIFSLVTMTMTVAGDDALALQWSLTGKKKKFVWEFDKEKMEWVKVWRGEEYETRWRFITLYVWRVMDIVSKLAMYALFYNMDGGGIITVMMLAVSFSIGGCVYLFLKFKLSISLYSKCRFQVFTKMLIFFHFVGTKPTGHRLLRLSYWLRSLLLHSETTNLNTVNGVILEETRVSLCGATGS